MKGSRVVRVAIDTNVVVAALTTPTGSGARILRAWRRGELEVVCSTATLREAKAIVDSEWLARLTTPRAAKELLGELRARAVVVRPATISDLPLKDEGDLHLVEAAVAGGASYLVTSDRELLQKRGYGRVEFVTPSELLRALKELGGSSNEHRGTPETR
jgi:putative PIN family toxin of toxin-antitoxin system